MARRMAWIRWTWQRRGPRVDRAYPTPLTLHQLWMVGLGVPVSRDRRASWTTLYPYTRIDDARARRYLAEQWEIESRPQLSRRLAELARTGYRARAQQQYGISPLAWDAGLYTDIARHGFAAGLLTEGETWTALKDVVPVVARTYASWQEYAADYLRGRQVWADLLRGTEYENVPGRHDKADAHLRRLLDPNEPKSPWNLAPFDVIRGPDRRTGYHSHRQPQGHPQSHPQGPPKGHPHPPY